MDYIIVPPGTKVPEEYASGMIVYSDRPYAVKFLREVKALIIDPELEWKDVTPEGEGWPTGIRVIETERPERIRPLEGGWD